MADSFVTHSKNLPTTFIETIRAGEESGNLEGVFNRLHDYFDKRSKTKAKVLSAMIYPLFVVCVAVVVVGIIMVFAVPMFSTTFATMNIDLPFITKAMIAISKFLTSYILIILLIIAALVIGLRVWGKTPKGRFFFGRLALKLPIFGRITLMSAASQYASTMSIMLSAGLSVIKSVDITGLAMGNYVLGKALQGIIYDLEAGKRLGLCVARTEVFPELLVEMTSVGEETGSLESTLKVVGDYYDNEVEVSTARALSILEPTIIVVLAFFVVCILISVYLPLFTMYGSV
jgi:type IV pilus assembly protein PilC